MGGLAAIQPPKKGKNHEKIIDFTKNAGPFYMISCVIFERIELERWDWSQINEFFMYFTTLIKSEHF